MEAIAKRAWRRWTRRPFSVLSNAESRRHAEAYPGQCEDRSADPVAKNGHRHGARDRPAERREWPDRRSRLPRARGGRNEESGLATGLPLRPYRLTRYAEGQLLTGTYDAGAVS
jgi:hypothetical protein